MQKVETKLRPGSMAWLICLSALAVASCQILVPSDPDPRLVHERLLTLDTHLDTPALLVQEGFNIMERHDPQRDGSQVDLPRMKEGGLDGGFWAIYTPQGPLTEDAYRETRDTAILRAVAIHGMLAAYPNEFELATVPDDAARIAGAGKRIVYLSIENAYPLGEDLSLLATFHKLGVRMLGPVHFRNNQFADSATDPMGQQWGGLSPLGVELVQNANRMGFILDASHAHDDALRQMMALSQTPVILSHSGCKAIFDHPRNIDDDLLRQLAAQGGVIQINTYSAYLKKLDDRPERRLALEQLAEELSGRGAADRAWHRTKRREIDALYPPDLADFEDFMAHLMHALKVVGADHVGIGPDWDGGGGVTRLRDVTGLPAITERLLAVGYSEQDLQKIWSGNVLRVLGQIQDFAARQ
jgi:membrane dipeptidase